MPVEKMCLPLFFESCDGPRRLGRGLQLILKEFVFCFFCIYSFTLLHMSNPAPAVPMSSRVQLKPQINTWSSWSRSWGVAASWSL